MTLIPAKGLELRCNRLNIFQSDGRKIQEQWESIVGMGLTVPEVAYDMTRSLAMDLETCSVVGSNGRFLVYAIGFWYMDRKVQLIAQTVEDLRGGLMWRAVQEWQKIAEEVNAGKEGKDRKPLYVYAHNGSKFDAIEVYVMNKLNLEKDAVELVPATATANVYKAWHELDRMATSWNG